MGHNQRTSTFCGTPGLCVSTCCVWTMEIAVLKEIAVFIPAIVISQLLKFS